MKMSRTQIVVRLVLTVALLYFVYWVVFTNAGAGR
jgi:hypothetical protein